MCVRGQGGAHRQEVSKVLQCLLLDECEIVFTTLSSSAMGTHSHTYGAAYFTIKT